MNWFNWFNKATEEVVEDAPAFIGTTRELLTATQEASAALHAESEDAEFEMKWDESAQFETPHDKWLDVEILKLAFQIEQSTAQRRVVYVDVGNLPKAKAELALKAVMDNFHKATGDLFLSRREGATNTEIVMLPGKVTLDDVLDTAERLKLFID